MTIGRSIPEDWIRRYVDALIAAANKIGPDSPMGQASLLRADHAMDLVKAYRERASTSTEGRNG